MSDAAILQGLLDDANERISLLSSQLERRTFERDTLIQRIEYARVHGGSISIEFGDTTSTIHAPPPDNKDSQR